MREATGAAAATERAGQVPDIATAERAADAARKTANP